MASLGRRSIARVALGPFGVSESGDAAAGRGCRVSYAVSVMYGGAFATGF